MDRYTVISSDCHCGPPAEVYRDYLDPQYRENHDETAALEKSAAPGFGGARVESFGKSRRQVYGAAAAVKERGAYGAYDPAIRARELDRDGLAGEVIFPVPQESDGASPPFRGGLGIAFGRHDPVTGKTGYPYELRFAGAKAYNRWLAEFCATSEPERHAGVIIVDVDDPEAAVDEIRRARKSGLFGGVNIPVMQMTASEPEMFYHHPRYEPIWAACEELDVPLQSHAFGGTPIYGDIPGTRWINSTEIFWVAHRLIWTLIWGGVMERHPKLRVVVTEATGSWLPHMIALMDDFYYVKNHEEISKIIPNPPSFYWNRQCYLGASTPFGRREVEHRDEFGVRSIMWGSDYPHKEGTWPYTEYRMKAMFAGVPEEETALMLGGNAAQCYNFDLGKLDPIAARVGPIVSELSEVTEEQAKGYWESWTSIPNADMG